jgi:precorrin-3B synthase
MSANSVIAEPATVKGWCPGALRPMQTGDGLIVRVRPRCGELSLSQVAALGVIAGRYGNGHIDLTRRANLQIRGVEARDLPHVWEALSDAGLIDAHADVEAVRNVMVSPLAGIDPSEVHDVRPIAAALETALTGTADLWSLPGKFGFIVDGGGLLPLDGEHADIRLRAVVADGRIEIALGIDAADGTRWLRLVEPSAAHTAAVRLALAFVSVPKPHPKARVRDLEPAGLAAFQVAVSGEGRAADLVTPPATAGPGRVGAIETQGHIAAVGIGAPFGRVTGDALCRLADEAASIGVATLRLSPWRVLYAPTSGRTKAAALIPAARNLGFVTEPADTLMVIDACPGAPACRSAWADTRAAARRIAALMPLPGVASVHVSGCPKGCARSRPADLVLVASPDGFGIVRHGTAATPTSAVVNLNDLPAVLGTGI